jgi:AcrR family transcriptional regulator
MRSDVKRSPRRYRSVLRAAQAQDTRRRIVEAAAGLFIDRGYAGTTIKAVAAAAQVAAETVYATFGGKRELLQGVIETTILTWRGSLAPADRALEDSPWGGIARLPTARDRLRAWIELSEQILAHTSPIHAVIRGAMASEPAARDLHTHLLADRRQAMASIMIELLADDLRPGLSIEEATESFLALSSPEMYGVLRNDLGWSADRWIEWLTRILESELLGSLALRGPVPSSPTAGDEPRQPDVGASK